MQMIDAAMKWLSGIQARALGDFISWSLDECCFPHGDDDASPDERKWILAGQYIYFE